MRPLLSPPILSPSHRDCKQRLGKKISLLFSNEVAIVETTFLEASIFQAITIFFSMKYKSVIVIFINRLAKSLVDES